MVMGVLPSAHDGGFDEDGGLIEGCRRGCGVSHRSLYQKYAGKVYGFSRRFLGDEQHAEDVVQEVFLRVVESAGAFKHEARFTTWAYTIAKRVPDVGAALTRASAGPH